MSSNPGKDQLRILAFEPFDGGSHRAIRESITRHSRHRWTWITRPARAWKWRMRLAALEMVRDQRVTGEFDAIFATSLLNAAELRGCLPQRMRHLPLILSMHENQVVYPTKRMDAQQQEHDVQFALTNLASALCADAVAWNSQWNQSSFIEGIGDILRHAPDLELRDWEQRLRAKSAIIWPPVESPEPATILHKPPKTQEVGAAGRDARRPIRVVWPHRWEHDKGPDELLQLARAHSEQLNLRWTILGERFRTVPTAFADFKREFDHRIDHFGFEPDRATYWRKVADCDWVLSTAHHEFFGVAVVEALLAGCLPWLPNRLSYPEIVTPALCGLHPADPISPNRQSEIRKAIRERLTTACAPVAIAALDRFIDSATCIPARLHGARPEAP